MKIFRVLGLALLLLMGLLTSCAVLNQMPPDQAVKLAIAHQLTHTQQAIAQDLGIQKGLQDTPNFKIDKLTIQGREKLNKQPVHQGPITGDVYRVRGTFSATLDALGHPIQESSPFDIYLSTNPQDDNAAVKTWFLIEPDQLGDQVADKRAASR